MANNGNVYTLAECEIDWCKNERDREAHASMGRITKAEFAEFDKRIKVEFVRAIRLLWELYKSGMMTTERRDYVRAVCCQIKGENPTDEQIEQRITAAEALMEIPHGK